MLQDRHHREEKALVRAALERSGWTLAGAARLLGCPLQTLQYRIRVLHPDLEAERHAHQRGKAA